MHDIYMYAMNHAFSALILVHGFEINHARLWIRAIYRVSENFDVFYNNFSEHGKCKLYSISTSKSEFTIWVYTSVKQLITTWFCVELRNFLSLIFISLIRVLEVVSWAFDDMKMIHGLMDSSQSNFLCLLRAEVNKLTNCEYSDWESYAKRKNKNCSETECIQHVQNVCISLWLFQQEIFIKLEKQTWNCTKIYMNISLLDCFISWRRKNTIDLIIY